MSQTIGFVGVGRMGANMARRLKDCGYTISAANDVNKEAAAALAEENQNNPFFPLLTNNQ